MARKLITFDDETWHALVQLGRDRMGDIQDLADEAFADLLAKHGVPKNLKEALRRSAAPATGTSTRKKSVKKARAKKRARPSGTPNKRAGNT
jgi:hypothetical protein